MPPLLELVQSRKVTATVTIEQSTAELVDRYAQYVSGEADEVVDKALIMCFRKTRTFRSSPRRTGANRSRYRLSGVSRSSPLPKAAPDVNPAMVPLRRTDRYSQSFEAQCKRRFAPEEV